MHCVYCNEPVPKNWFEHHCIPVARVDGKWVDMYNHLQDLPQPIENVAHWLCHLQERKDTQRPAK